MIHFRLACLGLERGPFAQWLELTRVEQQVWHIVALIEIPYIDIMISQYCTDIGRDILVLETRHPYIPVSGVDVDPSVEENFDVGAISGWQS